MVGIDRFPDFVRALPEVAFPFPGCQGWLLQGETQQVVFVEFTESADVPEHQHDEQWEFCVAGRVTLERGSGPEVFEAGDNFFIPAGVPHSAKVEAGYRAIIVFNAPDRYARKE